MQPNLADLTDEEYFWEPIQPCWSVRRRHEIRSPDCWGRGDWVVETSLGGSGQPAATTIAWRLMHAYDCTRDFTSRAFGHGPKDWNLIDVPANATGAVALMTAAVHHLQTELAAASDEVLLGPLDADFHKPRWLLLDKALLEAIHHTAEIGVLRALRPA
jgi:hypothetical protein